MPSADDKNITYLCTQLANRFCVLADQSDAAGVGALFVEDASFERGALRIQGREGIERMVASKPAEMKTRHLLTTSLVTVLDEKTADARHYCLVFAGGAGQDASRPIVREYQDRCQLTEDGWRIHSRVVITPFES